MKTPLFRIASLPARTCALSLFTGIALGCAARSAQPSAPAKSQLPGARAYDFNLGCWQIKNRKLEQIFQNSRTWNSFVTTQRGGMLLSGLASYDEIHDAAGAPIGMSLHTYDRRSQRFSSSWVSTRDGVLQPAVTGGFSGDGGLFEGDDVFAGKPIRVRNVWSRITTPHPRWEQAFSADAGRTWETNWIMDYTRIACARASDHG